MNKGSIVERLCSDLDRKEPRYKSPTLLFYFLYHTSIRVNIALILAAVAEEYNITSLSKVS